ncbi:xanthine dehydrogenase small subunit [Paracidovorax anthurii]|uniref:Xanthine dehydrogenase small subunit n=1 Tax=Paracidovorax anthurii TaxID=78229 RepID=A0A328ZFI3_9BURK|nr:xanthine dehydrogenase small subunit [Paracidovorax anthurii]RAR84821.1 xanthine dehydrogenase small subunit [Paracidovorax anthurii]
MTPSRPIRFIRRGQPVALDSVPPDRMLLEVLREDLGDCGTKEGCGEGDCGACTVVLGSAGEDGRVRFQAVNSCIRLAHSIDGMALWTVEDLAHDPLIAPAPAPDAGLHPAQEALVRCHGSQCGFCTPGFVMSLFGMYQNHACRGRAITRELAAEELSGNLCRCTGYRPILEAAQRMAELPPRPVDEPLLLQKLEQIAQKTRRPGADSPPETDEEGYWAPPTLAGLLAARAALPGAQVVAGATDVGLWITKQHRRFAQVLDVTRAQELRRIATEPGHLAIGAAATLADAFAALAAHWPVLRRFAARFAGLPVRNSGTLGGNIANGSPIGDSMPVLIALGARLVLASVRGERTLALEDFYTGYRRNLLAPDEIVAGVRVPLPAPGGRLAAWKVSKRFDDDISAVCLAVHLSLRDGVVQSARIGAGGVAAVPARARAAEAALAGQPWSEATALRAGEALQAEFSPISDMRASGAYRREVLAALLRRCWLESPEAGDDRPTPLDQLAPLSWAEVRP